MQHQKQMIFKLLSPRSPDLTSATLRREYKYDFFNISDYMILEKINKDRREDGNIKNNFLIHFI